MTHVANKFFMFATVFAFCDSACIQIANEDFFLVVIRPAELMKLSLDPFKAKIYPDVNQYEADYDYQDDRKGP
jgi:hypothetical protein